MNSNIYIHDIDSFVPQHCLRLLNLGLINKMISSMNKEYFKFPLILDETCFYIHDSNMNMVFSPICDDDDIDAFRLIKKIVNKLNGETTEKIDITYKDEVISANGKELMIIRGWGYLTSPSCCGLDNKTAANYQDNFVNKCIDILKS